MNIQPFTRTLEPDTVIVYVWTDFVCPFCLLGERSVKEAISGLDARLVWMPFELRPHPTPTLKPEDDYLVQSWQNSVYPMAERLKSPIKLPTVSPQPYTRTAFIGMQYAAEHGLGNQYVEAVLRAFFQNDRDIGDPAVLADIAAGIGLAPQPFAASLSTPEYAQRHDDALELAQRIGIRSVPSILIGNSLFTGVSDAQNLRQAVRRTTRNLLPTL